MDANSKDLTLFDAIVRRVSRALDATEGHWGSSLHDEGGSAVSNEEAA